MPAMPWSLARVYPTKAGGFRSRPNRSSQWRRLLCLSYNAFSDGGGQRDQHDAEFRGWLQDRYAEYGKTSTFFL